WISREKLPPAAHHSSLISSCQLRGSFQYLLVMGIDGGFARAGLISGIYTTRLRPRSVRTGPPGKISSGTCNPRHGGAVTRKRSFNPKLRRRPRHSGQSEVLPVATSSP